MIKKIGLSAEVLTQAGIVLLICVICGLFCLGAKSCGNRSKNRIKSGSSNVDTFMINAPSNLSATVISSSQINLSWQDNSNNEDSFEIYLSIDGITYTLRATVGAGTASYSDSGLAAGTTYYYRVRAMNTIGDRSAWSNEVSATTLGSPPPPMWGESPVIAVAAGGAHTLALTSDGIVWSWGANGAGQLGLSDTSRANRTTPSLIEFDVGWNVFENIASVRAGFSYSVALKTGGTLWAWGQNEYGQLGVGDTLSSNWPIQIGVYSSDSDGFPILISADSDWTRVAAGSRHTIALKVNGSLWVWGWNQNGQLGLGDAIISRTTPTQVGTQSDWSQVSADNSFTLGLKTSGTIWAWGDNSYGQLGLGGTIKRDTPTQIGTQSDWTQISAGSGHTIVLKTNRTLWAWGINQYGELGLGDTNINRFTPTQIGTDSDWTQISAGYDHTVGLKSNLTLWAWGSNIYGQLGDGSSNNLRDTPIAIGTKSDWLSVTAGYVHTIGLKTNNTLWAWGINQYGQLGLGDTIDRNIPCPLGSPTPPSSLTGMIISSTVISLSWTDNSINETGFKIERKIEITGTWETLNTVVPNLTSYADTGFSLGTTYYYLVKAYNDFGNSPYSNEVVISFSVPTAPLLLTPTVFSSTRINLSWVDNSLNETDFIIERSFATTSTYMQIATVDANVITYADTTVTSSNTYYYRVKAYNPLGGGLYSNEANTSTIPLLHRVRPLSADNPPTESQSMGMTAGYRFSPAVNGQITALGRYIGSGTGNTTVILWDDSGVELDIIDVSSNPGWQWVNLSTPINISAGTFYRVSVSCTNVWYASFSPPTTRVNITLTESCYAFGSEVFPATFDPSTMWGWADIEFVAE
jgi:alpha-tubulin suppressor-like RCC1 family protein